MIPQSVTDSLTALQVQKDITEAAATAKTKTAGDLVASQNSDVQAATVLAQATSDLNTKRQQVEAIMDSFYTVGGSIPISAQ